MTRGEGLALALLLASAPVAAEDTSVRIAGVSTMASLQLVVMRDQKLIEKRSQVTVEWTELGSGSFVRDAMVAGQVDVGLLGVPPFIQAVNKGFEVRIICAAYEMPMLLNTNQARIKHLKDFTPTDRIAVPALGSVQHITLQMAAERELGDPKALDGLVVAMAQPEANAALLSNTEITANFSMAPFQYQQLEHPGIHKVLDSLDVVGGPHSGMVLAATRAWAGRNPKLLAAVSGAMDEAQRLIREHPEEAAKIYVRAEGLKVSVPSIVHMITAPGTRYVLYPTGLMKYATFMQRTGLIKSVPKAWTDYVFAEAMSGPGN